MTADELKRLKTTDEAAYRAALGRIEAARLGGALAPVRPADVIETSRRSLDSMAEFFRRSAEQDGDSGSTSQLSRIHQSVIYACVNLRANMLAGLPLRVYRVASGARGRGRHARGRVVDLRNPTQRMGMPHTVRGARLVDVQSAEVVEDGDLVSRLALPNSDWTGRQLVRQTEVGLCLSGKAYWQMHYAGKPGQRPPTAFSWIKDTRVEVVKPRSADDGRTVAGWKLDAFTAGAATLEPEEVAWFRFVDPADPDYGCLSPADVARIGADSYDDAMRSNRDIFRRGLTARGLVMPGADMTFASDDQMRDLELDIASKLMGRRGSHGVAVMKHHFDFESFSSISPKDAEFVALMDFAVEHVARVYGVPIEFVGGARRTYQNLENAQAGIWQMTLEPEACWIADELTRQVATRFGDDLFIGFDLSGVTALQEDESLRWAREKERIELGLITTNDWRETNGLDPSASAVVLDPSQVGNLVHVVQAVAQGTLTPDQAKAIIAIGIGMGESAAAQIIGTAPLVPTPEPDQAAADAPRMAGDVELRAWLGDLLDPHARRAVIEYGSAEHRSVLDARDAAVGGHEREIQRVVESLLKRQRESLAAQMRSVRSARASLSDFETMFNKPRWVREFRTAIIPALRGAFDAGGSAVKLKVGRAAPPVSNAAVNFLRKRAQRFATEVNNTTWERLKDSLGDGLGDGETMRELAARVDSVMGDRIASSAETIARTEALGAFNGGGLETARATGLALQKTWVSALDSRVRSDHEEAHGQAVGIDDDFEVGGATGPGPGLMGDPEQDINCRCTMVYEEASERGMKPHNKAGVHSDGTT